MAFLIGILTVFMVLDCIVLVLLVLVQLPKKEAGAGLAFGGGASDALFGAGSGTVLTKITRWAATAFFVLAVGLAMMQKSYHSRGTSEFEKNLAQPGRPPVTAAPATPATPPAGTTTPLTSSNMLLVPQPEGATIAAPLTIPAPPATNPAAPK